MFIFAQFSIKELKYILLILKNYYDANKNEENSKFASIDF